MKHVAPPLAGTPPADRMHGHPHYLRALRLIGGRAEMTAMGIAVRRQIGPLKLTWLPAPGALPAPGQLRGITLIRAGDAAMDAALSGSGAIPVMTPQSRALLDLTAPEAERRAALHQKWRNRLTRAEGAGLCISHAPLPADPGHWLLRAEAAQQRARGYRALPAAFALAWPETRLFIASREGHPVAAMLFLLHGSGATYHIGWSGTEGRRANAHTLLLWRAGCWLAQRGCREVDLGSLDTGGAPGLARFKLGAGARIETGGHSWLHSRMTAPLGRWIG